MISWRDRGRGGNSLGGGGVSSTSEGDVSLPLGPGEWEEALGLPLCVVCQNVSYPRKDNPHTITYAISSLTALKSWRRNGRGRRKNSISYYSSYGQYS